MIGIENLKIICKAAGKLGSGLYGVLENKKVGYEDIDDFLKIVSILPLISALKPNELKQEIEDLSDEECLELSAIFAENFNIPNVTAEELVEKGMVAVISLVKFMQALKSE